MVSLIIFTVSGNCALIYCIKIHAKAYFLVAKGLFYCPKVLNYVHYTVKYAHKLHFKCIKLYALYVCSVEQYNTLNSDTITIPPEQLNHHGT